jgi:hypothetical protein
MKIPRFLEELASSGWVLDKAKQQMDLPAGIVLGSLWAFAVQFDKQHTFVASPMSQGNNCAAFGDAMWEEAARLEAGGLPLALPSNISKPPKSTQDDSKQKVLSSLRLT